MTTPADLITAAITSVEAKRLQIWNDEVLPLVESPIEALFLAAVFASNIDWGDNPTHIYTGDYCEDKVRFKGDHLWPQAKIAGYCVDFLIEHIGHDCRRRVIVECDGHDFHDRTKHQASADRARDRDLLSLGFLVVRFTGSDLHRDPFTCWAETRNVLWGVKEAA